MKLGMRKKFPSAKALETGRLLLPLLGKKTSRARIAAISAKTGLSPIAVARIERRLNQRWLVHKTRREFLQGILSKGLIAANEPTRNPAWFAVNKIFDNAKPDRIKISRTGSTFFSVNEVVRNQLAWDAHLLAEDFLPWYSRKEIEDIDWTRARARVDIRKAMVFDEEPVDSVIEIVENMAGKDPKGIRTSADLEYPENVLVKNLVAKYWRTGISFADFERYYSFDIQQRRMVRRPGAPTSLPEIIGKPEILFPGNVPKKEVRKVNDFFDRKIAGIRRDFGIEH